MASTAIWKAARKAGKDAFSLCDSTLERMKSPQEDILKVGDFYLDLGSRTASVRGRGVNLSHAEFDVLVYLISNKKRVITARTRLNTRSEYAGVQTTEFLRNLLSLKKKLQEANPFSHYIQTESWVLYDFHCGQ
jgi:DNA-binding response OmpR family regulator